MNVLFDTSVLVGALVTSHPEHTWAIGWLRNVHRSEYRGFVSQHSLAELYAVLTTLPVRPRIQPAEAMRLIDHNVLGHFDVVSLDGAGYCELLERHAEAGMIGGTVYDAVIAQAARKAEVDVLVTLNARHFRLLVAGRIEVVSP